MKKTLKYPSNYIIGSLIGLVGVGLPFLIWGIRFNTSGLKDFPYHMTMLIFGLAFALIGLIIGDIPGIVFKIKCKEYNPQVPEELVMKGWRLRWPCYIGSLITLISIGIIGCIYLATGAWPLL